MSTTRHATAHATPQRSVSAAVGSRWHFRNLGIGHKLGLALGLLVTLLAVMTALTYVRLGALEAHIKASGDEYFPKTVQLQRVKDELNQIARNLRNLLLMTEAGALKQQQQSLDRSAAVIAQAIDKLADDAPDAAARAQITALGTAAQRFDAGKSAFLVLSQDGRQDEAKALLVYEVRDAQLDFQRALDRLIDQQIALVNSSGVAAQTHAQATRFHVLVLAGAALASIVVVLLTMRSITPSITANSAEIAAGNLDLSSRSERQAASLEVAASSMEAMPLSVRHHADDARQANMVAVSAAWPSVRPQPPEGPSN